MALKPDQIAKKYKLNANTTVVIKSIRDGQLYKNSITVTHETADLEALSFPTARALEQHVRAIDMEEAQQEMSFGTDDE